MNDVVDSTRRALLRGAAATLTTLAAGVTLIAEPAAAAGEKRKRWGLLIDAAKCTEDCTACVTACRSENGWGEEGHPATDPQWLRKLTVTDRQNGTTISLPMLCQHCARPPCVDVCPTGASFKRGDGIVQLYVDDPDGHFIELFARVDRPARPGVIETTGDR